MKITNYILAFATGITLLSGCKDNASKPSVEMLKQNREKEVAALKPETASFKIDGMTCAIGVLELFKKLSE